MGLRNKLHQLRRWALKIVYTDWYVSGIEKRIKDLEDGYKAAVEERHFYSRYAAMLENVLGRQEPLRWCDTCQSLAHLTAQWILSIPREQRALLMEKPPGEFGDFIYKIWMGAIPREAGKEAFNTWLQTGEWPKIDKIDLTKCVNEVVSEEVDLVKRFRTGDDKLFGPLVGKVVKKCKGTSTVDEIKKLLMEALKKS